MLPSLTIFDELPTVKGRFLIILSWVIAISVPVFGQEKLYPVRVNKDVPLILTPDRSAVVVEKAFHHKLTLGSASEDRITFVPSTRASILILWLRIQNVSQGPIRFDVAKFSSVDDQGRMYAALLIEDATSRILEGASYGTVSTKTLRSLSLGRAGNRPTEEQLRDDIQRYSLQASEIPAGSVREGLIYFERPKQKKFTLKITLGDLWSQPLVFSTEKQK